MADGKTRTRWKTLLAVIRAGPQVAQFLPHLQLPAKPNDIVQVHGPPEALEPPDVWDEFNPDSSEKIDLPFYEARELMA